MRDHCCHQSDFLWWSPLPQALPEGSPPGGGKLWSSLHSRQGTTPHFSQQNQTTATGHCKSCWCCGLGSSYVSPMYFIHNWRQYGQHQSKLFFETTALLPSGIPIDQQAKEVPPCSELPWAYPNLSATVWPRIQNHAEPVSSPSKIMEQLQNLHTYVYIYIFIYSYILYVHTHKYMYYIKR